MPTAMIKKQDGEPQNTLHFLLVYTMAARDGRHKRFVPDMNRTTEYYLEFDALDKCFSMYSYLISFGSNRESNGFNYYRKGEIEESIWDSLEINVFDTGKYTLFKPNEPIGFLRDSFRIYSVMNKYQKIFQVDNDGQLESVPVITPAPPELTESEYRWQGLDVDIRPGWVKELWAVEELDKTLKSTRIDGDTALYPADSVQDDRISWYSKYTTDQRVQRILRGEHVGLGVETLYLSPDDFVRLASGQIMLVTVQEEYEILIAAEESKPEDND